MRFNINNKKHIEVLNFIGRWKRITSAMLNIQFEASNRSYWKLLLDSMKYDGLIKEVKSALKTAGKPATLYYLTPKGAKLTTLGYKPCIESNNSEHINKIAHEVQILKLVKQVLKLKDDQYLTDYELLLKWEKSKKELKMPFKPRLCDFAYYDKDGQLIGCEVEINLKTHERYIDKQWGVNYRMPNEWKEHDYPLTKMAYVGKDNRYSFLPKNIKTLKQAINWIKTNTKQRELKIFRMYCFVFKDGKVENINGKFVNTANHVWYVYARNIYQAKKWFFKKHPEYWKSIPIIFKGKKISCIWERQNYALDHNFYKKVIWYLPTKEYKLFNDFINKTYKDNQWEMDNRVQIQCLDNVKNESMSNNEFETYMSNDGNFYLNIDKLIKLAKEKPYISLSEAIMYIFQNKKEF